MFNKLKSWLINKPKVEELETDQEQETLENPPGWTPPEEGSVLKYTKNELKILDDIDHINEILAGYMFNVRVTNIGLGTSTLDEFSIIINGQLVFDPESYLKHLYIAIVRHTGCSISRTICVRDDIVVYHIDIWLGERKFVYVENTSTFEQQLDIIIDVLFYHTSVKVDE